MSFRKRVLASFGAGALGLAAAGAFATPALAVDGVDLGIEISGGKIAAGAPGKDLKVSLTNHSEKEATGILVAIDISGLDLSKVTLDNEGCNEPEDGIILCGIQGDRIDGGKDVSWLFRLTAKPGSVGPAGTIKAAIEHEGSDPNTSNNTASFDVEIVKANGPDLLVIADDVSEKVEVDSEGRLHFSSDLRPGETGALLYFVANQGDEAADGVKITVNLPEGATFTEEEPDCEYSDDNRTVVCTYDDLPMIPAKDDTSDEDKVYSAYTFYNLVTVDEDVTAPATLTGGVVTVEPLVKDSPMLTSSKAASELPANVTGMSAKEIDASDNTDKFSVIVAGDGGTGGGLPVTGAQAGLIGGIGAAVVVAGVVLFLVSRRRKVVLVTPGDEKSAE